MRLRGLCIQRNKLQTYIVKCFIRNCQFLEKFDEKKCNDDALSGKTSAVILRNFKNVCEGERSAFNYIVVVS